MSTKYKIRDQTKLHFITFAVVELQALEGSLKVQVANLRQTEIANGKSDTKYKDLHQVPIHLLSPK